MVKKKVAILYGGPSAEHEISILTALQAMWAMDPLLYDMHPIWIAPNGAWYSGEALFEKSFYQKPDLSKIKLASLVHQGFLIGKQFVPIDICFLAFHGQLGEDGAVQGMLENGKIPYTQSPLSATSVAMDKTLCKRVFKEAGLPTLEGVVIKKSEAIADFQGVCNKIISKLPFPLFVKPNHLGSSIGVGRAETLAELKQALAHAFVYDTKALIEPCITNLLEINVSVLEGETPRASVVEVPHSKDGKTLTFEDKYKRGGSKTSEMGMASLSREIDPEWLNQKLKESVQQLSIEAFCALDLGGVVRFDYLFDKKSGALFFNELNPIPGSLSYYLWEKSNPKLLYPDLIDHLINCGLKRFAEKLSVQTQADKKLEFR